MTAATTTRLTVTVPFGAVSGKVTVRTTQGEGESAGALKLRTSVSGFVQDTALQPLKGARVRLPGTGTTVITGDNGSFILPDVPAGPLFFEVDTDQTVLPFPGVTLKMNVMADRDNQYPSPITAQQATGPSVSVGSTGSSASRPDNSSASPADYVKQLAVQTGDVVFEVPANAKVRFPDGKTSGNLVTTLVEKSRVPTDLPPSQFSSAIVQITPFGVTLSPGGKLTFPNPDGFPAGAQATLFRFDQTPGSPTLGTFVSAGTATVSADGQKVETAANAIAETSYYFVSIQQQITTVVGRVIASEQSLPIRQAIVQARGQGSFTDGNGGFIARDVAVKQGDKISVEASFQRASGRVDHFVASNVPAVVGGITIVNITLLPENNLPVIIIPPSLSINAGQKRDFNFLAYDPDSKPIGISFTLIPQPANFASILPDSNNPYILRLMPGINDVGIYSLTLKAAYLDGTPGATTKDITITVTLPPPPPGSFTLTRAAPTCDTTSPSGPGVELDWTPSKDAASYDVYRDVARIAQGLTGNSYFDKDGLTAGRTYTYVVRAVNSSSTRDTDSRQASISSNICGSSPVTVSLPTLTGATGSNVTIPIIVGDLSGRGGSTGVIAFEFDFTFDSRVLQFQSPATDVTGTLSSALTIVTNESTPGRLRVAGYGPDGLSSVNRTLLNLKFRVVGTVGTSTALIWQKFQFNEGDPPVSLTNGGLTVN